MKLRVSQDNLQTLFENINSKPGVNDSEVSVSKSKRGAGYTCRKSEGCVCTVLVGTEETQVWEQSARCR